MKKPKKSKTSTFTFFDFLIEQPGGSGFIFGTFVIPVLITFLSWIYLHFLVIVIGPMSFYLTYKWLRHVYEREVNSANSSQLQRRAQSSHFWFVIVIIVAIISYIFSKYFLH
jgi:1,4-dihydroxy-2-naphthoate octaprenyltransferase